MSISYKFSVLNMRAADASSIKVPKEKPDFKKGKQAVIKVKNHKCKDLFCCLLAGRDQSIREKGFKGSIFVDSKDILETRNKESFAYICDPRSLPAYSTVGDFLTFSARSFHISGEQKEKIMGVNKLTGLKNKSIGRLEAHERALITLALASMLERGKSEIYLFYNTVLGVNAVITKGFKDQIMELVEHNYKSIKKNKKPEVIEALKNFNYDLYCEINRLNKQIFNGVKDYLIKGEVIGIYRKLLADMGIMVNLLQAVSGEKVKK